MRGVHYLVFYFKSLTKNRSGTTAVWDVCLSLPSANHPWRHDVRKKRPIGHPKHPFHDYVADNINIIL
uniref:Uncharacterized protein n=1 Tax=Lepeophtheirus salmonis TaxID=72036 RepID=A0A0K2V5K5_LEPSM